MSIEGEETVATIHRAITESYDNIAFENFENYLEDDENGPRPPPLCVRFKSVTTYGRLGGAAPKEWKNDARIAEPWLRMQHLFEYYWQ